MFGTETPSFEYRRVAAGRSARLRLRVSGKGVVIVSAPARTPQWLVNRFLNQHEDWIHQQQARAAARPSLPDDEVLLFGKNYRLIVRDDPDRPGGCHVDTTVTPPTLAINPLSPTAQLADKSVQSRLNRFLRTTAAHYILPRVASWAEKMQISYTAIQLREQRSRWGSCSSTGTLNFNWRLVHAPPTVIDYVIIHELAHRQEMNHSDRFWKIVAQYDPAHRQHRGWLKREGIAYIPDGSEG